MGVMICIYRHGYYYDDLRDDVIGCACGTDGGEEICIQDIFWKSWKKRALARLCVNGKKILKRALKTRIGRVWTGLMMLSTRTDGELLTVFSTTKFLGVSYFVS